MNKLNHLCRYSKSQIDADREVVKRGFLSSADEQERTKRNNIQICQDYNWLFWYNFCLFIKASAQGRKDQKMGRLEMDYTRLYEIIDLMEKVNRVYKHGKGP